jgi:CBS domain-containing protein
MAVASILAQKGREVVTASPDRTLQDVATILAERKIGAIVITDGQGKVLGMLSERDIVRAMARQGAGALDDPVSRHMTERVVTTTEDATIPGTMEVQRKKPVRSGDPPWGGSTVFAATSSACRV